ncbi:MAG TPA: hypothetical protein VJ917_00075, partial [Saprospiraceae bacterium]|nr:hypothetical protein [Saprospiraceae bacterium]
LVPCGTLLFKVKQFRTFEKNNANSLKSKDPFRHIACVAICSLLQPAIADPHVATQHFFAFDSMVKNQLK